MADKNSDVLDELIAKYMRVDNANLIPPVATSFSSDISKMAVDVNDLKSETIPNPIVLGGLEAIGLRRIQPIEIPKYLLMHPAIPRAIEIKANRMVKLIDEDLEKNVVSNKSGHKLAEEAREYCRNILYDSDGSIFVKKMVKGSFGFGTSFSVLQTNKGETEVLRFEYQHEIWFGPARYPKVTQGEGINWDNIPRISRAVLFGKMKIDPKTKKIDKYTQLTRKYPERSESNFKIGIEEYVNTRTHPALKVQSPGELAPTGKEFDQDEVMQLAFDTIGDEPLGISLYQYLQLTVKYLLNMERAGAQSQVNFGFNKYKVSTPFKDPVKMKLFAATLANIQKDSVIVLPKDVILENIIPGTTDFNRVHSIYLQTIAMRTGIPYALLVQSGTQTNKATIGEMRKEMYEDFYADEIVIEKCINDGFFKACKFKYKKLTIKELNKIVPKFKFNMPPEDKDQITKRNLNESLTSRNYGTTAKMFSEIGLEDTAKNISKLVDKMAEQALKEFEQQNDEQKKEKPEKKT